jgi:hypothetical protein
MTKRIKIRKRLAAKSQIVATANSRENDGKSNIGTGQRLKNLPGYNSQPNCREHHNLGFVVRDSGLDLRNCLTTSWGRNKPPPPRKKLFFGFVNLNY